MEEGASTKDLPALIVFICIVTFVVYTQGSNYQKMRMIAYKMLNNMDIELNQNSHLPITQKSKVDIKVIKLKRKLNLTLAALAGEKLYDCCTNFIVFLAYLFNVVFFLRLKIFASLSRKMRKKELVFYPSTLRTMASFIFVIIFCTIFFAYRFFIDVTLPLLNL